MTKKIIGLFVPYSWCMSTCDWQHGYAMSTSQQLVVIIFSEGAWHMIVQYRDFTMRILKTTADPRSALVFEVWYTHVPKPLKESSGDPCCYSNRHEGDSCCEVDSGDMQHKNRQLCFPRCVLSHNLQTQSTDEVWVWMIHKSLTVFNGQIIIQLCFQCSAEYPSLEQHGWKK